VHGPRRCSRFTVGVVSVGVNVGVDVVMMMMMMMMMMPVIVVVIRSYPSVWLGFVRMHVRLLTTGVPVRIDRCPGHGTRGEERHGNERAHCAGKDFPAEHR
jgi:hypothetical protein